MRKLGCAHTARLATSPSVRVGMAAYFTSAVMAMIDTNGAGRALVSLLQILIVIIVSAVKPICTQQSKCEAKVLTQKIGKQLENSW